jgi:hypothetical protein
MDDRRPARAGAQNPAYRPARPPPTPLTWRYAIGLRRNHIRRSNALTKSALVVASSGLGLRSSEPSYVTDEARNVTLTTLRLGSLLIFAVHISLSGVLRAGRDRLGAAVSRLPMKLPRCEPSPMIWSGDLDRYAGWQIEGRAARRLRPPFNAGGLVQLPGRASRC